MTGQSKLSKRNRFKVFEKKKKKSFKQLWWSSGFIRRMTALRVQIVAVSGTRCVEERVWTSPSSSSLRTSVFPANSLSLSTWAPLCTTAGKSYSIACNPSVQHSSLTSSNPSAHGASLHSAPGSYSTCTVSRYISLNLSPSRCLPLGHAKLLPVITHRFCCWAIYAGSIVNIFLLKHYFTHPLLIRTIIFMTRMIHRLRSVHHYYAHRDMHKWSSYSVECQCNLLFQTQLHSCWLQRPTTTHLSLNEDVCHCLNGNVPGAVQVLFMCKLKMHIRSGGWKQTYMDILKDVYCLRIQSCFIGAPRELSVTY